MPEYKKSMEASVTLSTVTYQDIYDLMVKAEAPDDAKVEIAQVFGIYSTSYKIVISWQLEREFS